MSSHILLVKILNLHVCELYGINHYRMQGQGMFSEAYVILSTEVVSILPPPPLDRDPLLWTETPLRQKTLGTDI